MEYKHIIRGFDSGLNEVLNGVHYDYKRRQVVNYVKLKNDELIIRQLRLVKDFKEHQLKTPIVIHYEFYVKDKRRDRMNIASAFDKSYEDALQKTGILKNDGWNEMHNATFGFHIDKENPRVEVTITEIEDEKAPKSISAVFDEFDSIMDKYPNDNFGLKYHANRSLKQGVEKGKNDDNHISTE